MQQQTSRVRRWAPALVVFALLLGLGSWFRADRGVVALGHRLLGSSSGARQVRGTHGHAPREGSAEHASSAAGPSANAPFDVGAIVEQVHFAYRPIEGSSRFEGGHTTYTVEVDANGATLVPYHARRDAERLDGRSRRADVRARPERRERRRVVEGAPLTLSVRSIGRSGAGIAPSTRDAARVENDGHLVVERGPVSESYRNLDEGVEQSWGFPVAPAGRGDLVVRVAASGLRYVGETERGLHFADARTGLGFAYGHATWIDARGAETRVPARFVGGAIELAVPSSVVEASAYPAVLDPVISPEFEMDQPVFAAPEVTIDSPRIAYGGTSYLAVWSDNRAGTSDIWATRIGADGTVLDPSGIPVAVAPAKQTLPDVASDGTGFFVVWTETRNDYYQDHKVRGARVSAAGVVAPAVDLSPPPLGAYSDVPCIASNGAEYLVVWQGFLADGTDGTLGLRLSPDGSPIDAAPFLITTGGADHPGYCASNGTDFLVAWAAGTSPGNMAVFGSRVTAAGVVSDVSGIPIATSSGNKSAPMVGSDGTDYLVAWVDYSTPVSHVTASRVTAGGVVLDPSGISIPTADGVWSLSGIASNGQGFLLGWTRWQGFRRQARATFLGLDGALGVTLDLPNDPTTIMSYGVAVASSGTDYFAAWTGLRDFSSVAVLSGARISSATSTVLSPAPLRLSTTTDAERRTVVAAAGDRYVVAWSDDQADSSVVRAVRISSSNGAVLDPSGITLGTATQVATSLDASCEGTDCFVVWQDSYDATGRGLDAAGGTLLGSETYFSSSFSTRTVAVATSGGIHGVAYSDSNGSLFGRRIRPADGAFLDAMPIYLNGSGAVEPGSVSMASIPEGFVVAWSEQASEISYRYRIRATTWPHDPSAGPPPVLVVRSVVPTNQSYTDAIAPSVAAVDGHRAMITWSERTTQGLSTTYSAGRALVDPILGTVAAAGPTLLPSPGPAPSSVAFDGTDYLYAWFAPAASGLADHGDLRIERLRTDGSTADGASFVLQSDAVVVSSLDLASATPNEWLSVYSRLDTAAPNGAPRAKGRLVRFGTALGNLCQADTDCESGHCVDGVCCDSACGAAAVDCWACATSAGAAVDGHCSLAAAGSVCRGAASECDAAERCDGSSDVCPDDAARPVGSSCGGSPSGLCDAQDVCEGMVGASATCAPRFAPSTVTCAPATCSQGHEAPASSCTGTSTACPTVPSTSCGLYTCGASACRSSCDSDADCASDAYCSTGHVCLPKAANGTACSAPNECSSNHCVDGVCCDTACDGACEACAESASPGTCVAVTGAPRGARTACVGDGSACAGSCDGQRREACSYPAQETVCRVGSCTTGTATLEARCDGTGACPAEQTQSCGSYPCNSAGSVCAGDCASDADCTSGHHCSAGICVANLAQAASCGRDGECGTGHCVDGVCCDTACDGACEACAEPSSPGTCTALVCPPVQDAGAMANVDAGMDAGEDAGADASVDAGTKPMSNDGCSCTIAGARSERQAHGSFACLVLGVVVARRRRRRRALER